MRSASIESKQVFVALMAVLTIFACTASAQNPSSAAKPPAATTKSAENRLPKIWHSEATHKDFRVEIKGDVFRADWVDLPAAAAKVGAYTRIECLRTETKWVGSARVYQEFADPKAPAGKDVTKMCHLTTRFEVDSITPEKIAFHTEALRGFNYSQCQVLKTAWEAFAWAPKR